jgi:hypothetical protein
MQSYVTLAESKIFNEFLEEINNLGSYVVT